MEELHKKKLSNAAFIVMTSTILSRITGYMRDVLIPSKLGVNWIGDAYNVAFLIPDLMYQLLLGGAIAAALIPVLSGYIAKKDEKEGWKAVGTFFNIIIIAMVLFCFLGIFFTPGLIPLVAEGFKSKPIETQLLAIKLTRILFPSCAFLMLAGLCNGVLNSYQRFAAAAYGPVLYNLGSVLSLYFLGSVSDKSAVNVAIGVMCSSFIYFLFQLFSAFKNFKYFQFKIYLKDPGFKRILFLAIPSLLSSAIVQINLIISSRFVSNAVEGSLTLFYSANRMWQLPLGIFAQSMGVAILPTLSAKFAIGDNDEYKRILLKGIKSVLLFAIPSAIAFIVLGEPIMRVLYKFSKNFSEASVSKSGFILMFFSLALVSQSLVAIMTRAFFAVNDSLTPLLIGSSTIIINAFFGYLLFNNTNLNAAGMALAYSISSTFYAVLLLILLNKKVHGIFLSKLMNFITKVVISAVVMGISLYLLNIVLHVNINSKISQIYNLGLEVIIGSIIYFSMILIFRIEEGRYILSLFKKSFLRVRKVKNS